MIGNHYSSPLLRVKNTKRIKFAEHRDDTRDRAISSKKLNINSESDALETMKVGLKGGIKWALSTLIYFILEYVYIYSTTYLMGGISGNIPELAYVTGGFLFFMLIVLGYMYSYSDKALSNIRSAYNTLSSINNRVGKARGLGMWSRSIGAYFGFGILVFLGYVIIVAISYSVPEPAKNQYLIPDIAGAYIYFFGDNQYLTLNQWFILLFGLYVITSFFQILGLIIFGIKFSGLSKYYRVGWISYAGSLLVLSGIIGFVNYFYFLLPPNLTELADVASFLFPISAALSFALGIVGINGASRKLLFGGGVKNWVSLSTRTIQGTQTPSNTQPTPELDTGFEEENIRVLGTTYIRKDGTVNLQLYSQHKATLISARIEDFNHSTDKISPQTLSPRTVTNVTVEFGRIHVIPNRIYTIVLTANVEGKEIEVTIPALGTSM
ncbi:MULTISPECIES: DUF973 family protein [unclassified Stygiolobus]|uniref:DUF973 family protein n=1 Tax=unclassified Stygiolobus TaxID=2824672 RepID=UPI00307EB2BC